MSEHLSAEVVERYCRRVMPPAELRVADHHLAACEACRQRLREAKPLSASFAALRAELRAAAREEPDHLSAEELMAYVDHRLGEVEREIAESHLEVCGQCSECAHDLRVFKAELAAAPATERLPLTQPTRWEKFIAFWQLPAFRLPLQVAAAVALAALFVWVATRSLRTQVADLQAQVRQLEQTNAALAQQASAAAEKEAQLTQLRQEQTSLQQKYQDATADWQAKLAQAQAAQTGMPGAAAQVLLTLNDGGGRVSLDRQGHLAGLDALSPDHRQIIEAALTKRRVETPPGLARLIGKGGTLLGGAGAGAAFALTNPVGTVVQSDRPLFRWQPLSGATGYRVTVYDSNFNKVVTSPQLSETEWTASQSLERGSIYSWQVTALKEGREIRSPVPPAPEVKFSILDSASAEELARAQQSYANSHLTLGTLYARAGLLDEAEREFQALLQANPKSEVAQKLWRGLQALRRNPEARR